MVASLWAATPASTARHSAPASPAKCQDADASVTQIDTAAARGAVLCLINDARTAHGLPAYRESRPLDVAAQIWSNVMVTTGVFAHSASLGQRVTDAGLDWRDLGENIATGFPTPRLVVQAWLASLGHCQNMLDPSYRLLGIGVNVHPVRGYANRFGTWTTDFALPMGEAAPSHNWGPRNGCPY